MFMHADVLLSGLTYLLCLLLLLTLRVTHIFSVIVRVVCMLCVTRKQLLLIFQL